MMVLLAYVFESLRCLSAGPDNVTMPAFAGAILPQPRGGAGKLVCASAVSQRYHKAVQKYLVL